MRIKFDEFLEEVDHKYDVLTVDLGDQQVTFRNLLRVTGDTRGQIVKVINDQQKLIEESQKEDGDSLRLTEDLMGLQRDALRLAATDKQAADDLFNRIGDDHAVFAELFNKWVTDTQAGEA